MTCLPQSCPGPIGRRSFLKAGSLGLGGLGLSQLLRLRAEAKTTGSEPDTSVILIWLGGGPSHLETYDMKPNAPRDYRGDLKPIHTVVPGMDICEYLPLHAKVADKFNLIRSISHKFSNHAGGTGRFLSGRDPLRPLDRDSQYPCLGPIVAKMREDRDVGVPNYVANNANLGGSGAAYLGAAYLPFVVDGDPNASNFQVQNLSITPQLTNRLDDRITLLQGLDHLRRDIDNSGAMRAMDRYSQRAVSLLTSAKARNAFDLSQEDPRVRDRYGRHKWSQQALLARRLVEAGVSFVTMELGGRPVPGTFVNWDSHAVNCDIFQDARGRLPVYDRVVAALIEDIYQRGLNEKVMVIFTGEFGRTPLINSSKGIYSGVMQPGRDHYPAAMSVLVSGGGMATGQVIGSTTDKGEWPKDRKLDPNDLLATVYRHLGIDYRHEIFDDRAGRPLPLLPYGEPIAELS